MSFFDNLKSEAASAIKNAVIKSITITVLGKDNDLAKNLFANAQQAVAKVNNNISVDYVTDSAKIAAFGNPSLPALVVGDKVVFQGGSLKVEEIENIIRKFTDKK